VNEFIPRYRNVKGKFIVKNTTLDLDFVQKKNRSLWRQWLERYFGLILFIVLVIIGLVIGFVRITQASQMGIIEDEYPFRNVCFEWEKGSENTKGFYFYLNGNKENMGEIDSCTKQLAYHVNNFAFVTAYNPFMMESEPSNEIEFGELSKLKELFKDKMDVAEIVVRIPFRTEKGIAHYAMKRIFQSISNRVTGSVVYSCTRVPFKDWNGIVRGWKSKNMQCREIETRIEY